MKTKENLEVRVKKSKEKYTNQIKQIEIGSSLNQNVNIKKLNQTFKNCSLRPPERMKVKSTLNPINEIKNKTLKKILKQICQEKNENFIHNICLEENEKTKKNDLVRMIEIEKQIKVFCSNNKTSIQTIWHNILFQTEPAIIWKEARVSDSGYHDVLLLISNQGYFFTLEWFPYRKYKIDAYDNTINIDLQHEKRPGVLHFHFYKSFESPHIQRRNFTWRSKLDNKNGTHEYSNLHQIIYLAVKVGKNLSLHTNPACKVWTRDIWEHISGEILEDELV